MADIEIVIKIPEKEYKRWKEDGEIDAVIVRDALINGTPLPKGHKKLIILSEDAVKREQTPFSFSCQNWISEAGLSNATVAITEADNAEGEVE